MSVPVWKRNQSKVEFLANFHKMRTHVLAILMRDFGIKQKTYTVQFLEKIYEITDEDKQTLEQLMAKYGMSSAEVDKYPDWLVEHWRDDVMILLRNLGIEIELGNSIYISKQGDYETEYTERRKHFSLAIGYCNALKDKFQEILSCIDVKVGAYEEVSVMLQKEISLLKGVRQSDNRRVKQFRDRALIDEQKLLSLEKDIQSILRGEL